VGENDEREFIEAEVHLPGRAAQEFECKPGDRNLGGATMVAC
jgi:hypothetical protein